MKQMKKILSLLIILTLIMQPIPVLAKSKIDIVFIIDRSGSMGGDIRSVRDNINNFVDLLAAQGIDYQLGLLSYEDSVTRYPMTNSVETFKSNLNKISDGGGVEDGLDAIADAINNYAFEVNASQYFVIIGDERITSDQGNNLNSIKNMLIQNDIILTGIGAGGAESDFRTLANATGGLYLSMNSDYGNSLTTIFDQIQTIPILEIISPTANQLLSDLNTAFIPTVRVTDPDSDTLSFAYYIDSQTTPKDTRTVTNTKTAQLVSFNALNIATLTEGNHTLKFTVNDGSETVQDIISIRVDKSSPTLGTISINPTDTTMQISGSATDGIAGLDANPYQYTVGSIIKSWTNLTSHTITNLTPNTAYSVKFEARDLVGHIAEKLQTVYTKAQTPILSIGNSSETSFELSLTDSNPSSTQYQIMVGSKYVNSSGTLTTTPIWITDTDKRMNITGLTTGSTYSIKAKAKNYEGSETGWSTAITGHTLCSPPSNISVNAAQRSISLSWTSITGATGYDIEIDGAAISNGSGTSYTHLGLAPNTQHTYRIRGKNAAGTGVWSNLIAKSTLPDPPPVPSNIRTTVLQTEINISWDAVAAAAGYDIEVDGQIVENGSNTSYLHKGLLPLTQHAYRVRAKNPGGISEWTAATSITTLPYPPTVPTNISAQATKTSVSVAWDAVQGATAYEVEIDGMILDNGANITYLHDGLEPYSGHTYRVRAKNIGGKSPWSSKVDITTYPEEPKIPTNIMATSDESSITLTWYKVPLAESYEVEIDGSTIKSVTDTMFVHTGLNHNTQHTYRVRAKNISGDSAWSDTVTMMTMPEGAVSLTNIIAIVTNQSIMLSWDAVAYEVEYEIEVDGSLKDNGKDTIYNHTDLEANQYHTYKIRVKNGKEGQEWCAVLSLATLPNAPDAPVNLEAFANNNTIELRWTRAEGATGYDVEIDGESIDNGMNESYIHENLSPGTSHLYRVRAKNITGVTAWSPSITKSTTTPTYVVDCSKDKLINFSLLATNVQDFSEITFVVSYNPNELEVVDLYGFTPEEDKISQGQLQKSGIYVNYVPGRIELRIDKNIIPGTSWSGEITDIIFKAKIDGQSNIDFKAE
jgi:hypothetical protein